MTRIVWMSDPHFQGEGTIDGLNPRTRVAAAIDHANLHYPDADFAILSGDLVGGDLERSYAAMAGYLEKSRFPVYPMMGNNDERQGFRRHLSLPQNAMPDFVQFWIEAGDCQVICLDTHKPGSHAGQLCAARGAWLDDVLARSHGKPAYIFMHHPPFALGLPRQDEIRLDDGDAFLDLICRHRNVRHLFMGHVHRPVCGTIRGIPFATIGAISFQAPAPRPAWDWDSFCPPAEAPHYAVVEIRNEDVTVQYIQFCQYDLGIE